MCNFILSALASLTVTLARLSMTLGEEGTTGIIHEGLVKAETPRRGNCWTRAMAVDLCVAAASLSPIQAWECHITITRSGPCKGNIGREAARNGRGVGRLPRSYPSRIKKQDGGVLICLTVPFARLPTPMPIMRRSGARTRRVSSPRAATFAPSTRRSGSIGFLLSAARKP